jgi:hypothetical protein
VGYIYIDARYGIQNTGIEGEAMIKAGCIARSIQIPEWMNEATKELARKNRRSVNAQIEIFVEEQLTKMGYKIPDASPIGSQILRNT